MYCFSGFPPRVRYFYYFSQSCIIAHHAAYFVLSLSLPTMHITHQCCLSLLSYYRLFSMHLLYYSFVLLLASLFLLQSTTLCSSQSYRSAHHTSPHHTASQQYSHLNRTTFAAALLFTRSRSLRFRSFFLLLFVLLSGDIELNPGPSPFTCDGIGL